jgi:hypothetical protein
LRTSDRDGADGVVPALGKIVAAIRRRCQRARIILRGDSGFGREEIMTWGEAQPRVYYWVRTGHIGNRLSEDMGNTLSWADALERSVTQGRTNPFCGAGR